MTVSYLPCGRFFEEQIEDYRLPTRPVKHTDSRAKRFRNTHGERNVKLDAFEPDDLRAEIRHALATRATLIEGAAAAPFAALRRFGAAWPTRTVLIQSGANLSLAELQWVLADEDGERKG